MPSLRRWLTVLDVLSAEALVWVARVGRDADLTRHAHLSAELNAGPQVNVAVGAAAPPSGLATALERVTRPDRSRPGGGPGAALGTRPNGRR